MSGKSNKDIIKEIFKQGLTIMFKPRHKYLMKKRGTEVHKSKKSYNRKKDKQKLRKDLNET